MPNLTSMHSSTLERLVALECPRGARVRRTTLLSLTRACAPAPGPRRAAAAGRPHRLLLRARPVGGAEGERRRPLQGSRRDDLAEPGADRASQRAGARAAARLLHRRAQRGQGGRGRGTADESRGAGMGLVERAERAVERDAPPHLPSCRFATRRQLPARQRSRHAHHRLHAAAHAARRRARRAGPQKTRDPRPLPPPSQFLPPPDSCLRRAQATCCCPSAPSRPRRSSSGTRATLAPSAPTWSSVATALAPRSWAASAGACPRPT